MLPLMLPKLLNTGPEIGFAQRPSLRVDDNENDLEVKYGAVEGKAFPANTERATILR